MTKLTLRELGYRIETTAHGPHNTHTALVLHEQGDGSTVEYIYYTNASGLGLWRDGHQVEGTAQFHAVSPQAFRRKLREYLRASAGF